MLFKNILVPWDGSKPSLHAFKVALDIAKKYDSKISVVHCIQNEAYRGQWFPDPMYSKSVIKKQTKSAESELEKLIVLAKNKNVQITTGVLVATSIVKQIVAYAKSKKIDLVIMGSHGRTGWSKTLYGSVANGVSQNVRCPVLIVR